MLLDANGNPIRKGKPVYQEIASIAREDVAAGFVGELRESQDEILRGVAGSNLAGYRRLLTDDQVQSTYQQRRNAIISREWDVQPGGKRKIDKMAADWLREQVEHIGWDRTIDKMHFGIYYGHAVGELMYARDGKYVNIDRIKVRDRSRFKYGREFELKLILPDNPMGETMPPRKFWVFQTGADNDDEPYGLGLAHYLYWPVYFKRHGIKFWLIFIEKFAHPTPIGKYAPGSDVTEQRKLLNTLAAMTTDLGIIVPQGTEIDKFEAARTGSVSYDDFRKAMNESISKINLSQTMTTDNGSSLAQGEVHMDVREEVVKGDSDLLTASFNNGTPFSEGPVQWLTEWNFPGAEPPAVWYDFSEAEDLNQAAERDGKLYQAGWERDEKSMTETYGKGYRRRTHAPPTNQDATEPAPAAEFAEAPDTDSVQAFAGKTAERAQPHVESWVDTIRKRLDAAGDLRTFGEELATALTELEVEPVAGAIGDGMEAAHLAGRSEGRGTDR